MSTETQIAALEARIEELAGQLATLQEQVAQSQLDQWEGRIDDLEVQMRLGSMEVNERLAPLVNSLRDRWLDAKEQVGNAPSTATDVLDALRAGLEQAMKDIRDAVVEAKTTVTG